MSTTLMARVDGLPVVLLERERVWPASAPARGRKDAKDLSASERARFERQTAVVRETRLPGWARALAAREAEELRLEIRGELAEAGLL